MKTLCQKSIVTELGLTFDTHSFLILNLNSYGFTERSKNQNKFGKEYPKNHFSNEDGGFCQVTQGTMSH